MKVIPLGSGTAPDVSVVDGLVYAAFGVRQNDRDPGQLTLAVYTPQGALVKLLTVPNGIYASYPAFDGPWLVYRQSAEQSFAAAALNVVTGKTWFYGPAGGTYSLKVSEPLGLAAFEQERPDSTWHVWFGSLINGSYAETPLEGAPDGLERIVDNHTVALRKDTRTSMPGIIYPVRARDLVVGERPESGIAILLDGDRLRVLLAGDCNDPRGATDSTVYAIVCWGDPGGVRLVLASRAELLGLPLAGAVQSGPPAPSPQSTTLNPVSPTPTPAPPVPRPTPVPAPPRAPAPTSPVQPEDTMLSNDQLAPIYAHAGNSLHALDSIRDAADWAQGAREAADVFRQAGRDPSIAEMIEWARMRAKGVTVEDRAQLAADAVLLRPGR